MTTRIASRVRLRLGMVRLALAAIIGLAPAAVAQENPFSINGSPSHHSSESVMGVDQVDPLSGNLMLVHTDLSLPGNAGLDLRVTRYYNSNIYRNLKNSPNDFSIEERSWVGIGWRLHFGRVINPDPPVSGQVLIELADGSRHAMYQVASGDPWWRSADFFLYNPTTHVLKLPNGLVYTFGHLAAAIDGGSLGAMRYVTEIRDPFNNTLTFSYFASPGPTGGVQQIQQDLGSGQVRTVTFGLDDSLHYLGSMTYNGRTWLYQYLTAEEPGYVNLEYVRLPHLSTAAVRMWTYYPGAALHAEEIALMKTPTGGEFQFAYQTVTRTAGSDSYTARVLSQRHVLPTNGQASGSWTFSYDQGTASNETHVVGPSGTTVYRYNGVGSAGPYNAWLAGTLAERRRYSGTTLLERQEFSYIESDALINEPVGNPNDPWYDVAVYRPLLSEQTVTRDPNQSYEVKTTTHFGYHTGDGTFNDYGNAWHIYQQNQPVNRSIQRTFKAPGDFAPYLLGRVLTEDVTYSEWHDQTLDTSAEWRYSTYDASTGFVTAVNTDGVTSTFEADAHGNVATSTDLLGVHTHYQYAWGAVTDATTHNATHAVVARTQRTIPGPDPVASSETAGVPGSTPPPLTTVYLYDDIGRLTTVTPPGAGTTIPCTPPVTGNCAPTPTLYTYGDNEPEYSQWSAVSRGTTTPQMAKTYTDGFGRAVQTTTSGGGATPLSMWTERDGEGRVVFQSSPGAGDTPPAEGTWTTYDALHRPTSVVAGTTDTQAADYSRTQYAYQGADVIVTDPENHATRYHYLFFSGPGDAQLSTVTDASGQETKYWYRLSNTLTQVKGPGASGPIRTWTYSPTTNRLASEVQPESGTVNYTEYDLVGRVTQLQRQGTDGTPAETTTLTYDALGRPYTRTTGTYSTTWTYDALGRQHTAASGGVVTTYDFDAVTGRPTGRTDQNGVNWTISTSYSFDDRDRLKTITYPTAYPNPGGRTVTYNYDDAAKLGQLSGVQNDGTSAFASDFRYDGRGRLESYLTGAVRQSFVYDRQNRPTTVATVGVQGTPDLGLSYGYQRNGNVSWIGDTRFTAPQQFEYDALDRLTSASGGVMGTTTLGWTYDAMGNRTTETNGTTTTYQYDATTQRLTGIVGGESFTYDGFGRVTQDSQATYTYRPDGALLTATRTGMTASYLYDADGLRVRSVVNGARLISIHGLGGQLLTEFDSINAVLYWKRDLIYAGGRLIGSVKKGTGTPPNEYAEYYASDTLGSVRLVFNAAGTAVGRSDYLPYGDALNVAGTLPKERFTGQQHDAETGLEFMNARSMQARTGRMNQPDPLFGNAIYNPQRWNRYAYVLNNPLKMVDPTGMEGELVFRTEVIAHYADMASLALAATCGSCYVAGPEELGWESGFGNSVDALALLNSGADGPRPAPEVRGSDLRTATDVTGQAIRFQRQRPVKNSRSASMRQPYRWRRVCMT